MNGGVCLSSFWWVLKCCLIYKTWLFLWRKLLHTELLPITRLLSCNLQECHDFILWLGDKSIYFIHIMEKKEYPRIIGFLSSGTGPAMTFQWTWACAAGWGAPEWSGDHTAICSPGLVIWPVLTFQNMIQWNPNLRAAGRQNLLLNVSFTAESFNCPLRLVKGPLGSGHELPIYH